jgi:hypothetical protein
MERVGRPRRLEIDRRGCGGGGGGVGQGNISYAQGGIVFICTFKISVSLIATAFSSPPPLSPPPPVAMLFFH